MLNLSHSTYHCKKRDTSILDIVFFAITKKSKKTYFLALILILLTSSCIPTIHINTKQPEVRLSILNQSAPVADLPILIAKTSTFNNECKDGIFIGRTDKNGVLSIRNQLKYSIYFASIFDPMIAQGQIITLCFEEKKQLKILHQITVSTRQKTSLQISCDLGLPKVPARLGGMDGNLMFVCNITASKK